MLQNEKEKAVLHLLFLAGLVNNALVFFRITTDEGALHQVAIARDIVRVCAGELSLADVEQNI